MTNGTSTVNPSEVGWQFVPQYYTFVNKHPNRLHCFYTKASTFIHGTEGEDGKPCYGQQEIHDKITSIGFQDCKVFIHSVDAQSSANGGIIIQVIGEMSNHGDPWRKFVQTFFLAEQPNGYFVLNDIFRFLKEETVESDEASETEAVPAQPSAQEHSPVLTPVTAVPAPPTPALPPPVEHKPEPPAAPTPPPPAKPAEEPPAPPVPELALELHPQANGHHALEEKSESVPAPEEKSPSPAPEPPATASPPPVSPPAPQHEPLPTPSALPAQVYSSAQPPAPAPAAQPAAPQPTQPPQRKTWANLAAKDSNKWGAAVANEVRGVSEAPATVTPVPLSGPQSPAPHVTTRPAQQHAHPALMAAQNVATAQCFVKSVTENIPEGALRKTLVERFGPIKELEILRSKACAFLEFTNLDAARRAIVASLPPSAGGEGGVRIEGVDGNARILVETRKERGERPPPRGPPMNGERGRGGYRGRGGPGGRGRGGPPPPK